MVNAAAVVASTSDPDASDNHDIVSTTVLQPDLSLTKSGPANANASATIEYVLTVTNGGTAAAAAVVLSDTLPAAVTFASASRGGVNNAGTVTWPAVSSLAAGGSFVDTVRVVAPAAGGTVVNVAAVATTTAESSAANNTSSATTTVAPPPASADLSISKSGPATANASDPLEYVLTVSNSGPDAATNVVVSDTLPAGVTFVDASGGQTPAGNTVTWPAVASLASGATIADTIHVVAPAGGGTVRNASAVESSTGDPSAANNTSSATTTVAPPPASADLSISKSGPATANASDPLEYVLTVSNNGPDAATNVVVSDTLPAGVTFVDASGGQTPAGNTVTWPAVASLASGATIADTIHVVAPAGGGTVRNASAVESSTGDPSAANNTSSATTTVAPPPASADLSISKSGPATANASDPLEYVLTVSNSGPDAATNVVVSDTLPAGVTFVDASGGQTPAGNTVTWPAVASLASGATIADTVHVLAPAAGGTVRNASAVESSTGDPSAANNTSSVSTTVAPPPPSADLVLAFSGAPGTVNVGDTITYSLQVTNNGPDASVDVLLSQALPTNVILVDADGGTLTTGTITWPLVASLPSGNSLTFTVKVEATTSGAADSTLSVTATTADPDLSSNAAGVTTTVN